MNQKHTTPMPGTPAGGVDLSQGMLLGGTEAPDEMIDLTKPVDDQTFRKATISILSGIADSLGVIAYNLQRGFPMIANSAVDLAETAKGLNEKLDAFGVIDLNGEEPATEATDEQPEG